MPDALPSNCPPLELIEQFVSGESESNEIRRHIEHCQPCLITATRIRENNQLLKGFAGEAAILDRNKPVASTDPHVPGYEIVSELNRGGQGIVYKAVHLATKRTVALKLLTQGRFATIQQRHRFEREVELIAALRHPNVVTLYDSGITPDGAHYYAMEYIRGKPLDEHCAGFSTSKRSNNGHTEIFFLFSRLCQAVQYAHQRGIIHRDLKPANILVDVKGEPHVLDFGMAKALGAGALGTEAQITQSGVFMGSFAYAAPEQITGDPEQIDIRTDAYALGVILYEMLTDRRPYAVEGNISELMHAISEVEPAPPSTFDRRINDEVDTIVLKALAKAPERRYQSVESLHKDINHYLNGEPIDAKRDSSWYVLRKIARRHWGKLLTATAFLAVVFCSTSVSWIFYQQREREKEEKKKVQFVADTRVMIALLMRDLQGPRGARLNRAIAKIEDRFDVYPQEDPELYEQLGTVFEDSKKPRLAELYLERALEQRRQLFGDRDPRTLFSMKEFAIFFQRRGRHKESQEEKRNDFEKSETLLREVLKHCRKTLPRNNELTLACENDLGILHLDQNRLDEAKTLFLEAFDAGQAMLDGDHPLIGQLMNNLGITCRRLELYRESEAWLEKALKFQRRSLPPNHPDIIRTCSNLGHVYYENGKLEEAKAYLASAVEAAIGFKKLKNLHTHLTRYADCLTALRRCNEEDRSLLLKGYELVENKHGLRASLTQNCIKDFIELFETIDEIEIADHLREKLSPSPETGKPF
ncbi:MAG: serine/threonine-protein kinase [Phycisphaerales bacterium]|nr:serine/threonine-protein kinase [Phycisphaerales bacterium]